MSAKFIPSDKEDLRELFRIFDFAKRDKVDELVSACEEKGTAPHEYFSECYAHYGVKPLPDREAAAERLMKAVPSASRQDVESAIRTAEMKRFAEADALRDLVRKFRLNNNNADANRRDSIASHDNRQDPGINAPNADITVEDDTNTSMNDAYKVQRSVSNLRSVNNSSGNMATQRKLSSSLLFGNGGSHMSAVHAKENMDEIMAEEVREWVASMIGQEHNSEVVSSPNFVDALRNGVVLHILAQKVREPPVPDNLIKVPKRSTGFFARDTIVVFLKEVKEQFNLSEVQLFTDSDLCDGKDDRQVISCLMAIARAAYSRGTIKVAPSVVMHERHIEEHGSRLTKKDLDRIVMQLESQQPTAADNDDTVLVEDDDDDEDWVEKPPVVSSPSQEEVRVTSTDADDDEPSASRGAAEMPFSPVYEDDDAGDSDASVPVPVGDEHQEKQSEASCCADEQEQVVSCSAETAPPVSGNLEVDGTPTISEGTTPTTVVIAPSSDQLNQMQRTRVVWKAPMRGCAIDATPPFYRSRHYDGIDVALGTALNKFYKESPSSPWRFHAVAANAGEYVLYNRVTFLKRVLYVRFVQKRLFMAHYNSAQPGKGPQWIPFESALRQLDVLFSAP